MSSHETYPKYFISYQNVVAFREMGESDCHSFVYRIAKIRLYIQAGVQETSWF